MEIETPWTFRAPISDRDAEEHKLYSMDRFDLTTLSAEIRPFYGVGDLWKAPEIKSARD